MVQTFFDGLIDFSAVVHETHNHDNGYKKTSSRMNRYRIDTGGIRKMGNPTVNPLALVEDASFCNDIL